MTVASVMARVGEVWDCDTTGRVAGRDDNHSLRVVEAVELTWVSKDGRVVEGRTVPRTKKGTPKKVCLNRGRLIERKA